MMLIRSGRLIDPLNIDFTKVSLPDLAWALDGINRWGAHCCPRITVAQHTVACARAAWIQKGPRAALLALHHDDGEAFFGDMCRDLKHRPEMAWYREQEEACTKQCIAYFCPELVEGGDVDLDAIKDYDTGSLLAEKSTRFPLTSDPAQWPDGVALHASYFAPKDDWRTWMQMHHDLRRLVNP